MTTNEILLHVDRYIRDAADTDGKVAYADVRRIIDNACYQVENTFRPVEKFIFVEDGSVDADELEESLSTSNPEIKVVIYRQGSQRPELIEVK